MTPPKKDPLYVQSVEKAFKVLAVFNAQQSALSLTDVTRLTGYSKSSAQRFCYTLLQLGYLRRSFNNTDFELTAKTTEIGARFIESNNLVRRARPYLHSLSSKTEGATTLSILDGNEVIFVSRFLGKDVLDTTVTVGSRLPIYCTASGRAAASLLNDDQLDKILAAQTWEKRTAQTEIDPQQVKQRIITCREQGYAFVKNQYVMADLSLAVPIYDRQSDLRGSINLAVTSANFNEEQLFDQYLALLQSTARAINS
ncbi:MAG: IclR family transcriptional regulator [Oceanospirillaceae bacterium]